MIAKTAALLALTAVAVTMSLLDGDVFSDPLPATMTRNWISGLPKSPDGRVDPLPVVRPEAPATFVGKAGQRDPFSPYR